MTRSNNDLKNYSKINLFIQKMASTRAAPWILPRTLPRIDRVFLKLTGERATLTSLLSGVPIVKITTKGARSGEMRTHILLCLPDQYNSNQFAVIASNFGQRNNPAWYYNLKANPHVVCNIRGRTEEYVAHEAIGEEYERIWKHAEKAYLGFSSYKQRAVNRRIPVMVLTRVGNLSI
jgi:deazaflavin-dependent oxidoreductase (nitroreductase family)